MLPKCRDLKFNASNTSLVVYFAGNISDRSGKIQHFFCFTLHTTSLLCFGSWWLWSHYCPRTKQQRETAEPGFEPGAANATSVLCHPAKVKYDDKKKVSQMFIGGNHIQRRCYKPVLALRPRVFRFLSIRVTRQFSAGFASTPVPSNFWKFLIWRKIR